MNLKKSLLILIIFKFTSSAFANINDTIVTFTTNPPLCYNDSNGSIYSDINMLGVFDYLWSTGDTGSFITAVPAGIYQLTISDGTTLINISTIELTQPDSLSVTSSISNPSSASANNGSIQLLITGGTSPYSFNWSTGQTSFSISNLGAGDYFFTVVDDNACELTDSIELELPPSSPWEIIITGSNHTILIPTTANFQILGDSISTDDFLGVFYDSLGVLKCAGFSVWQGDNTVISAFGNDPSSPGLQGMATGENFKWRIWRAADSCIYDLAVSYSNTFPNLGSYVDNGMSMVDSLSTLSIEGNQLLTTKDYSTGIVMANKLTDNTYQAVAWEGIDNLHYKIDGLEFGTYIVHALPNPFVNSYSPAYYPNYTNWSDAEELVLTSPLEEVNIVFENLTDSPNGEGSINGVVYADYSASYEFDIYTYDWFGQGEYTDSSFAMNIPVLLFNDNNQLIDYALTDSTGAYSFSNIPEGNYTLYAEKTGLNSDIFSFAFYNEMVHYTVNFHIQESDISFESYSANFVENNKITLNPNPVSNTLIIDGLAGNEDIIINNIVGREIYSAQITAKTAFVNFSSQAKGIYFISIIKNNERYVYKLIKQ